jgi:triphosphoribosyl-dephospho-CoA synthase
MNANTPMERRLACEADKGSPPPGRCTLLGVLAKQTLIAEAELTPKPGLVDRRGSGAHTDLSLSLMRESAFAIEPFIRLMALQSMNERPSSRLRATLAATGRAAERAMLEVTNGTNTHKGAIWTLGLLAAAAVTGRGERPLVRERDADRQFNSDPITVARTAAQIASFPDSDQSAPNASVFGTAWAASKGRLVRHRFGEIGAPNGLPSHGQIVAQKFGAPGARGEAVKGFPHIIELGLPMLRARRTVGVPESIARLDALLAIMSRLTDTCLLYRGGKSALQAAKEGAAAVLTAGGAGTLRGREHLLALDQRLLELGVSPGGSADMLAGTLFLDALARQPTWPVIVGAESLSIQ